MGYFKGHTSRMPTTFPDHSICQTRYFRNHVWECVVNASSGCPYVICIADRFFCTHLSCPEFAKLGN
jgi:hypothetical protein